jgi:hypothetical protein
MIQYKRILIVVSVFALFGIVGISGCSKAKVETAPVYDGFVAAYSTFEGDLVELVYDGSRRVELRIHLGSGNYDQIFLDGSAMQFLKGEAMRLAKTPQGVKLGNTGYSFVFTGGYPLWGPYGAWECKKGHFVCLVFAERAVMRGKTIYARGTKEKEKYYPYHI